MFKRAGTPLLLAVMIGLGVWGDAAQAGPAFMHTGGRTTQPIGHYEFCQREPGECRQKTPKQAPVELTRQLWATIIDINNAVNAAVTPRTDMEMWGQEEVWSYPDGVGDCEDYVLEKRRQLMRSGLALSNLLITVVRKPDGEGHAVLTVRTTEGDFVLDNLTDEVRPWYMTGYRFLKRQATNHTGRWVTIRDSQPAAPLVGSVK